MFLAYMKSIGFVPRLARVTPVLETRCTDSTPGFVVWWGRGHGRSRKKNFFSRTALKSVRVPIRNPDPFQQVGVFAVPRSRCGDRVDRHFTKRVRMGRHLVVLLVWVASCAPHGYDTSVLIDLCHSVPIPDSTSRINEACI